MFSKNKRLTTKEFDEVFTTGRTTTASYAYIKTLPYEGEIKVGVVVPKSVTSKAVERTSLRRKVFGILEELSLPPHHHIVIVLKRMFSSAEREAVKNDITSLFEKLQGSKT